MTSEPATEIVFYLATEKTPLPTHRNKLELWMQPGCFETGNILWLWDITILTLALALDLQTKVELFALGTLFLVATSRSHGPERLIRPGLSF